MSNETATAKLRDTLFATLENLQAGKTDANTAHAVSKLADNIIKTVIVEIQAAEVLGVEKVSSINGQTAEQRRIEQGGVVHRLKG